MPIVESNNMLVGKLLQNTKRKSLQLQRQSIIDEEQKIEHQEIIINNSLSLIQDSLGDKFLNQWKIHKMKWNC